MTTSVCTVQTMASSSARSNLSQMHPFYGIVAAVKRVQSLSQYCYTEGLVAGCSSTIQMYYTVLYHFGQWLGMR